MNMAARIERTPSAYPYPLLIRHMLERAVSDHPNAQIVYGQTCRTYRQLHERVGRLANALAGLGVEAGSTVGVMDWDTNRYLECFYAVPMMGAVLHMVNVRLSPEQIVYT
ncbi:MAG: AMP-binding protein, partial [Tepidiphilus sp.]|nr:AMP-binding protein [Tepidiphilus sp.]